MKNRIFMHFYVILTCLFLALGFLSLPGQRAVSQVISNEREKIKLDVPYEPSSEEVVRAMLEIAHVDKDDLVYDLGCGDGKKMVLTKKSTFTEPVAGKDYRSLVSAQSRAVAELSQEIAKTIQDQMK